jgi:small-conductance mechanosensitive channel
MGHCLQAAASDAGAQSGEVQIFSSTTFAGAGLATDMEAAFGLPAGSLTDLAWLPDLLVFALSLAVAIAAAAGAAWATRRLLAAGGAGAGDGWQAAAPKAAGALAAALCLWIAMSLIAPDGAVRPLLALAIAGATALLAHSLARLATGRSDVALAAGVGALLFTLFMLVGSLAPVRDALDGVGLQVGQRRITPLDLIGAILLGLMLFGLARVSIRALERWAGRMPGLEPAGVVLVSKIGGLAIIALVVLIGIDVVGLDLTALKFFSGALGLAVGFGLQKTFGNLIAGLILLMDRLIKPGDVIVVGDTFGWVNRIGVRAVSVLTRDGKEHLIPNELLMTERVENWSYSDQKVRVHIAVGVAYDSDIALVEALLLDSALAAPRVLREPPPVCWLEKFGESSVDFDLIVWIDDPEQGTGNVRSDILKSVWHSFAAHGIAIPFPQRDIRVTMASPAEKPRL